jgi:hypothetical protein
MSPDYSLAVPTVDLLDDELAAVTAAIRRTVAALYAIADQQGWLVGETLEHALAALQRELAGQGA